MSHPHPELQRPPRLAKKGLRVVGLGGLGEIGRNMTVFEHEGKLLIVDCGVLFPEEHQPGVDVILPDFTWIRDRLDSVVGIVLTHGHEDHIGGVPYLLKERADIPVIGSRLTLALVKEKMKEHGIRPQLREVREGDRTDLGGFDCEFIAVNHSIPDALAVAIRTAAGLVLHTGDFKMDQFPLDGRITDLRGFARLADEGVDLFMTDSTNAEVPGFTTAERDLAPAIETVFRTAPRRIIVSSFASHVHRIQQVLDQAHAHGRKVAFVGTLDGPQHGGGPGPGLPEGPAGPHRPARAAREAPGQQGHPDLHRLAGGADGGALADGQPRPQDPRRRGRHHPDGQLGDPGQRERHLHGDQRPHPLGRQRRAQGQRARCTSRGTRARASWSTATTSSSRPT